MFCLLKNVLDYVYDGEVKILQEDLDRFLNIAQKLKLEGLIGGETEQENEKMNYAETEPKTEVYVENENMNKSKKVVNGKGSFQIPKLPRTDYDGTIANTGANMNSSEGREKLNDSITNNGDGTISCNICGKTFPSSRKYNMQNHIETHLDGLSYSCGICEKTFRSKNSLNCHVYQIHR